MNGKMREWFRSWRWALAASLFLHALIAAFLFFGLPRPEQQPDQQEQPVNVAIVPPPDQPKPKPAPKPPEPAPEKKAEKPTEQPVQKPPPPQPPKPQDIPVLKPVFQYGQKDTGPEKSLNGGSAPANAPSPAQDQPEKPPVESPLAPSQPASPATPEQQADTNKAREEPATAAPEEKPAQSEEKHATEDTDKQQQDKQEAAPETAEKPAPAEKAKPKPSKTMKFKSARALRAPSANPGRSNPADGEVAGSPIYSGLPGVRKLYSPGATGNALATSSMENVPRDQRIANLCANVLNQELQSADYSPKWLPTIPLKQGNVLNPPQAAFSTTTQWYDLSFRCEVDADATRVLSFNFRVGGLVPPGDWTRRRFPSLR
ncbi:DUF930 domain-containing protein [Mesorhizobium sp. M2E.F.Ca.ET.209.01.1.1]|uniref:DUF930 domain-containing protein n=1 Tax=Mesorhizobium sp. M2E.F.Ca.ET.209.01.1.1 TaxID=2500526 RepID=UPI000FD8D814|nr:DUF930 domain-containing protein [Mesorhizobium sp. M2E.F.Ca.ET.209.01.1.1]TGS15149.1 DUF930 domain-containing protein [Mesorhizobium sp. M2E.F.Ca.ET.209.01.1.1]